LLIRPFIRLEAVLSSRIEGTQATLGELLASEAGAVVDRSPADLREVANYVVALERGMERLGGLPLSLRLARELHETLMRGVRGDAATPGEFRRSQNWIGTPGCTLNDATYVPPPPDRLMECLGAWETFLHDDSLPPLVHAALAHSQFEAIHPFLDGNSRVGRLLITSLIARMFFPRASLQARPGSGRSTTCAFAVPRRASGRMLDAFPRVTAVGCSGLRIGAYRRWRESSTRRRPVA
jgi:Fic family protein